MKPVNATKSAHSKTRAARLLSSFLRDWPFAGIKLGTFLTSFRYITIRREPHQLVTQVSRQL